MRRSVALLLIALLGVVASGLVAGCATTKRAPNDEVTVRWTLPAEEPPPSKPAARRTPPPRDPCAAAGVER